MHKLLFLIFTSAISQFALCQTDLEPNLEDKMLSLDKRVDQLEDLQGETSEILKRQLGDQYYDQKSRGYFEVKAGASTFDPEEVEDENDDLFESLNGESEWESFNYAGIFDFEIGKTILSNGGFKSEIGIGYQYFRSKLEADFRPASGNKIDIYETAEFHTLFARYAILFEPGGADSGNLYIGPGFTIGYSPVSTLTIEVDQGDEGTKVKGEGNSLLLELFCKAKFEFSRYISLVANVGYRKQEADNLRLNAAEVVSVATKTDLDGSGIYGVAGFAVKF